MVCCANSTSWEGSTGWGSGFIFDGCYSLSLPAPIHLGSCSFTATGWVGSFYPKGLSSKDFLSFYAEEFDSVELDVTWYRVPSRQMIDAWRERTPDRFVFAAKVPQTITHDKVLVDCEREMAEFLDAMEGLGDKLGPLLLQFPYFNQDKMDGVGEFLCLLEPFLAKLPRRFRFAVEVRNKRWVGPRLLETLRERGVAFALTDHSWMPSPESVVDRLDPITADFTYLRWLGDRRGIEEITRVWDKVVVDRTADLRTWADICQEFRSRGVTVFGYANNHYAGHSPATLRALLDLIEPSLRRERRQRVDPQPTLFDL